ncbi:molecular chaperone Hsp31 and glyoxalase 3 [Streptomyces chrestomyceticus JCM 4735]|uniref:Molecular chaperone Hsp31 and glyoxalase 3 n=1 Tax=Streptomyces chrestomyceticus JCM 4735 TaxID=1306181 RepID=A0A7U9L356_9ACTN|nr:molecular chaperone Hsp31 and glyoxalase 3 [Streptomyces chrestomyceticus JCM 4735]
MNAVNVAKHVLFVLTSHAVLGRTGSPTGFHLAETAIPWQRLRADGHTVDFASVRGGRPPVVGHDSADPAQRAFLADPDGGGRLSRTLRPEEVEAGDYAGVFFVGGHGTMWDFRGHPALHAIGRQVYESGGVLAAICHGPAAFVDLTLSDGSRLVNGRELTAFSHASEAMRGLADVVPFPLQTTLEAAGAKFSAAPDRSPHVVVSGRLVTGQNPQSSAGLGERMAELLLRHPSGGLDQHTDTLATPGISRAEKHSYESL